MNISLFCKECSGEIVEKLQDIPDDFIDVSYIEGNVVEYTIELDCKHCQTTNYIKLKCEHF